MDNKKRIKSLLMLSLMLTSLSSCSKESINISNNKYKIMKEYSSSSDNDNFYLIKVNNNDLMKDKNLKVIGNFNTLEEAREYLNALIEREKIETDYIIGQGVTLIIIGGLFYYFIKKEKKEEKVLKK